MPGPSRNVPGETEAERDRRRALDRLHRSTERENFLADTHEIFAQSRGWMTSKKECELAALFYGTKKFDGHTLPASVAALEASAVHRVTYRAGPGAGLPAALLLHSTLTLRSVQLAAGILRTAGLRPERLPFSFVNPRGCVALLIARAPSRNYD